jgi:CRISPR-associated RAMP protein (TIGR02581 family)
MFDELESRLELSGWVVAQTAFRIGAGRSTAVLGTDLPVVRDALGKPYIPGSSFKGLLRSRSENLIRAVVWHRRGSCTPTEEAEWCIQSGEKHEDPKWTYPSGGVSPFDVVGFRDLEKGLPERGNAQRDTELSWRVAAESCLACRTFGSPWLASPVLVRDLLVDESAWFDQFQVRNGVAIDRDTETASEGKLYDYEVIPSGTRFQFRLLAENAEPWSLGMLFVGLRGFQDGQVAIGGSKSRGLGWIKLDLEKRTFFSLDGEKGDARIEKLFGFLDGKGFEEVDDKKVKDWIDAFKTELASRAKEVGA